MEPPASDYLFNFLIPFFPVRPSVVFLLAEFGQKINELILVEKDFREQVDNHDWDQYRNYLVLIQCSNNAIITHWAYLLISSRLKVNEISNFIGTVEDFNNFSIIKSIQNIDVNEFKEKSVVVKGCSNLANKNYYFYLLIDKIQIKEKSLMFGEACSSVPIFKKKK